MKSVLRQILTVVLLIPSAPVLHAEIPAQVTVSLPVSAAVEGVVLEPGTYTLAIEGFDGGAARINIYREGSSRLQASAPVTTFRSSQPAPRNALKVTEKSGSYHLDKLVLAGETTGFQFRL